MSGAVIIPARIGSTRFPRKPLFHLNGKPLIQHTWEVAMAAQRLEPELETIIVATDSREIAEKVEEFGGKVHLSDQFCRNGTERVYNAAKTLHDEIRHVVNLQGDACLSDPRWVVEAYRAVRRASTPGTAARVSTIALRATDDIITMMRDRAIMGAPTGETTVVLRADQNAMYFSKAVIPHNSWDILQHVGIYGYTFPAMRTFAQNPTSPIETSEGLEQLRFLFYGQDIEVVTFPSAAHLELNNPEDAPVIEALLAKRLG